MSRRKKHLSKSDQAIWKKVTQSVEPLGPRFEGQDVLFEVKPSAGENPALAKAEPVKSRRKPSIPHPKPVNPRSGILSQPPAAAHNLFDHKTVRKISKGKIAIDARIDLHGMTQDQAITALRRFIHMSHASDFRLVLVITGKGSKDGGILRRRVPDWLNFGELASMVIGAREANPAHGGSGALYVRLRRAGQ